MALRLTLTRALTLTLTLTRDVPAEQSPPKRPFAASQSFANPSSSQTDERFAQRSPSFAATPAAAPPHDAQRDAFNKYDTNHSGELDHNELRSALETVGLKMTSAQAAAQLAKYDKDQSGLMEFDEFQQLCTALEATIGINLAEDST